MVKNMRTIFSTDSLPNSEVQLIDKYLYVYTREGYRVFDISTDRERPLVTRRSREILCCTGITGINIISGICKVNGIPKELQDYDITTGNLISSTVTDRIPYWYKFSISPRGSIVYNLCSKEIIDLRTGRHIDLDIDDLPTFNVTLEPGSRDRTWILRREIDREITSTILHEGPKRWMKSITSIARDMTFIDYSSYVYISPEGTLVHNGTSSIDIPKSMNKITVTKDSNIVIVSGPEKVNVITLNDIGQRTKSASKVL